MPTKAKLDLARKADTGTRLQYLLDFERYLDQCGFARRTIKLDRGTARHFLVWLEGTRTPLKLVNGSTIRRFRDHNCQCPPPAGTGFRYGTDGIGKHTIRERVRGANAFLRFLEESGHTNHPGELELARDLLAKFLDDCRLVGHTLGTIRVSRAAAGHFLTWLHQSRISIRDVNEDIVGRFFGHDCVCPGKFSGVSKHCLTSDLAYPVNAHDRYM